MKHDKISNYFVSAVKMESKVAHYFVNTFVRDGFLQDLVFSWFPNFLEDGSVLKFLHCATGLEDGQ